MQASSFSPPGAPEAPAAPMVSSPILIGSAPCAAVTLVRHVTRLAADRPSGALPSRPTAMRNVRAV